MISRLGTRHLRRAARVLRSTRRVHRIGRERGETLRSVHRAELRARAQETLWIDRFAVDAGLVVQMRSSGAAGRADLADDLASLDGVADLGVDAGEVAVARRHAVA